MAILSIIGGIVVSILLLILCTYLYLRLKYGKYLHAKPHSQPLKIHLVEDVQPEWIKKGKSKKILQQLLSLGFQQGKAFTIQEMQDVCLIHLSKDNIHAAVCYHKIAGAWVDFAIKTVDGKEYSVGNVPIGEKIEVPPDMIKYVNKDDTVDALYQRMQDIVAKVQVKNVPIDEFREFIESSYKKEVSWRMRKGGVSYKEFVAEAENFEKNSLNEKKLQAAFIEHKLYELYDWHNPAIEEYIKKLGVDPASIENLTYECFIVPFTTNAPAFIEYLKQQDVINDEQCDKLKVKFANETDIFHVFDKINNLFSPDMQAKQLAEQDYPLSLKIYTKPYSDIESAIHRYRHLTIK